MFSSDVTNIPHRKKEKESVLVPRSIFDAGGMVGGGDASRCVRRPAEKDVPDRGEIAFGLLNRLLLYGTGFKSK